jgi:hypothetical protein
MSKTSVSRLISIAVLMALLLAPFSTFSVVAKGNNEAVEEKWDQLVGSYNRQTISHESAHNWADVWLAKNKDASAADKAKIQKHLNICNSSLAAATTIVVKHEGFDSSGKVVDKAAARQSIKDLNLLLLKHAASVRNLSGHVN